jgi:hypothetical protein
MLRTRIHRRATAASYINEMLERRLLLCSPDLPNYHSETPLAQYDSFSPAAATGGLVWANRNNSNNNIASVFSTSAQQSAAYGVIDAAISAWARVFTNFNQPNGDNEIDITISFASNGTSLGASGGVSTLSGNKPRTSSISLGRGGDKTSDGIGDGVGWFLDPTPSESSEFVGTINNAFEGTAKGGSAAAGLSDLFSVVCAEMAHALGMDTSSGTAWRQNTFSYFTATSTADSAFDVGNLYTFSGPSGRFLFTSNNSGNQANGGSDFGFALHTAEPGNSYTSGGGNVYSGLEDVGNAQYNQGERYLPSNAVCLALRDVYGYTLSNPELSGTFYSMLLGNGTVLMRGDQSSFTSNDQFLVRINSSSQFICSVDIGEDVAGTGPTDFFDSVFAASAVNNIQIENAEMGADIIQVGSFGSAPRTVTINANTSPVALDSGEDLLLVFGESTADTYHVSWDGTNHIFTGNNATVRDRWLERTRIYGNDGNDSLYCDSTIRPVEFNGSNGDDSFYVGYGGNVAAVNNNVTVNGDAGNDTLYLGNGYLDSIGWNVTFNGVSNTGGLGDRVFLNDQGIFLGYDYAITPNSVTRSQGFGGLTYSNTSRIVLNCTQDANVVTVGGGIGPNVEVYGNDGNDSFVVGGGNVAPLGGQIYNGGNGTDQITFDDHLRAGGVIWDFHQNQIAYGGIILLNTNGFEAVGALGGNGADNFYFYNGLTQLVNADGGGGDDNFYTNGSNALAVTVTGGAGTDYLDVDDRNIPENIDESSFTPTYIQRVRYPTQTTGGATFTVTHGGMERLDYFLPNQQNYVSIYGTSPSISTLYSNNLYGNASTDVYVVYPHDAAGNLTIASGLYLSGGGDIDSTYVSDSTSFPLNLTISDPLNAGNTFIAGAGARFIQAPGDMESVTVNAGGGSDTFNLETYSHTRPLYLNGGGGDDTVNITPTSNSIASITGLGTFSFNGGNGNDSMYVHNGAATVGFGHYQSTTRLSVFRGNDAKTWYLDNSNVEYLGVVSGSGNDTFQVFLSPLGQTIEFTGGAGNDNYQIASILPTSTQPIQSKIKINGAGGVDSITINDSEDTVGRVFHISANTVGATPGDNLFGAGGSLEFNSVAGTLAIYCGTGADTIYAVPNATTNLSIQAGNPTALPGDTLTLGLADATGTNFVPGATGAGTYTFSNRQQVSYAGIETTATDSVRPAIASSLYDYDSAFPALAFQFGEDVLAGLFAEQFHLTNLTTGLDVPASAISATYNAASRTQRFTFFSKSTLPDGNYRAVVQGVRDQAGNVMSDTTFDFFALTADANRDRTVDTVDFNILAGSFGQSGRSFSQGNFNYDSGGAVDTVDFNLLAANFGKTLAAGAAGNLAAAAFAADGAGDTSALQWPVIESHLSDLVFGDQPIN